MQNRARITYLERSWQRIEKALLETLPRTEISRSRWIAPTPAGTSIMSGRPKKTVHPGAAKLADLRAQRDAIDLQIEELQSEERASILASVRSLIVEYGLTAADLTSQRRATSSAANTRNASAKRTRKGGPLKGTKVAAKFRHPSTGETWSGRGSQPRWLKAALAAGRKLAHFAI